MEAWSTDGLIQTKNFKLAERQASSSTGPSGRLDLFITYEPILYFCNLTNQTWRSEKKKKKAVNKDEKLDELERSWR